MAIIISTESLPSVTFFGDASSKNSAFMVAGGFAVASNRIKQIEDRIDGFRQMAGIDEFHWSNYKGGPTRPAYEALVAYAFELVRNGHAAFHTIISPFKGYKHKRKPGEGIDTSVNRMYYQLLLHRPARFYGSRRYVHVRLDEGADSFDICQRRNELCAAAFNTYKTQPNCVKSLQSLPSHKSGIIQMSDVILGGIAAKKNGVVHTTEKGPLADKILEESGRPSWDVCTPKSARNLTVWNFSGKD